MADKGNGKAVSRSPDLPPQQGQEGMLSLEEIAAFGISPEEYEQDRLARQSIAQKALDNILSGSYAPSTSRQSAQCSLKISQADFEEERQWREALARTSPPPVPPPSPQAGPSTKVRAFINRPGRLTALQKLLFHSATPRIRLDKDPFGVLESLAIKKTKRPKFKYAMPSIVEQLEDVVEAKCNLRQQALISSEADVQARAERLPPYDESPLVLYQVRVRPAARLPDGCRYGDWHTERGPKFGILELLKETMALLGVDWNIVQDLEDNDGFCFALGFSRGTPFQTPGWQSLVEVRRLDAEEESWEIIAPIEESRLVKEAKARFTNRLASSDTDSGDIVSLANLPGDGSKDNMATNDEQGSTESTNHWVASPLGGTSDMSVDEIDRNITVSEEEVHPESS